MIRQFTESDVTAAVEFSRAAGWNQLRCDWSRLIQYEPDGCWVAEVNGRLVGTVTTTSYGHRLAWIGMMLVDPDYRRRGVATALIRTSIEYLQRRGIHCIKLDATPEGKLVYQRLGFQTEWGFHRWQRDSADEHQANARQPRQDPTASVSTRVKGNPFHPPSGGSETSPRVSGEGSTGSSDQHAPTSRPSPKPRSSASTLPREGKERCSDTNEPAASQATIQSAATLDRKAFGANRINWLDRLARNSSICCRNDGLGMIRQGHRASYLGPLIAANPQTAASIVDELLSSVAGRVFWDVPQPNPDAVRLAQQRGFSPVRDLERMWLGEPSSPQLDLQYALSDPGTG